MLGAVFVLVIALGAIVAGAGYVRTAGAMRGFQPTIGRVLARDVAPVSADRIEGRWGKGGGYAPKITYAYSAGGEEIVGDRLSYAARGLKLAIARERAEAYPDEVTVWVDPADPRRAFLERHTPTTGWVFIAGGAVGALGAIVVLILAAT